ncbi:MAG: NADH-quinone oxidoreductase subunit G [Acidobacteria bacterium]|nr:MAG: NADH-quinone oxidoreductase subunit G [Acidobacteriota bacterium]
MPTLKIDGREINVEKGRTIIQVCEQLGIEVPRYCYHPGLHVVGSCRMCMVEVEKMPKLQIACNTPVADGMVVWTQTDKVKEARRSVLEFLLLNHPLDCPVCDRAGECELQNYYMAHAQHNSRLRENKIKKRKAFPIGPHVVLDQERCVLCSRCIRFTDEISKTGELGIFNRGTWSEVDIYPGRQLDNKYSGNVVDICPVGALLDRDFRYQMSVWYLKEAYSVCPGCSMGCNIRIHYNTTRPHKAQGRRIMRLKPRFNEFVNKYWMCDEGRYNYKWNDLERLPFPMTHEQDGMKKSSWSIILPLVADQIKKTVEQYGANSVGIVPSPQMTNEELYLVRKLFFEHLKIPFLHFYIPPKPNATEDNFLIKKDKNPNSRGAELILPEQKGLTVDAIFDLAKSGQLKLLYVFHTNLVEHFGSEAVREALNHINTVVYQGTNESEFLPFCTYVLAAATYAEKTGTFTNFQGRVQRITPAVNPMGDSRPSLEILSDLAKLLALEIPSSTAQDVFADLAGNIPQFSGMNYTNIGFTGKLIQENAAAAAD